MLNYTTATMVFLAVFLLNRYAWQEPIMGTALLVFFFGFYGQRLGKRILARHEPIFQTGIGALVLSSAILILGTFIYYLAFLPSELWTLFVLLAPVGVWLLTPGHKTRFHFPNRDLFHARRHRLNRADLILVILSILLLVALFQLIGNVEIFDAVRSTWERIPHAVLWLFFLLLSALGALAMKGHERSFTLPLVMLSSLPSASRLSFIRLASVSTVSSTKRRSLILHSLGQLTQSLSTTSDNTSSCSLQARRSPFLLFS